MIFQGNYGDFTKGWLKTIPILLGMGSDLKAVKKNTDLLPQIADDIRSGFAVQIRELRADIKAVKERLGMP